MLVTDVKVLRLSTRKHRGKTLQPPIFENRRRDCSSGNRAPASRHRDRFANQARDASDSFSKTGSFRFIKITSENCFQVKNLRFMVGICEKKQSVAK